MEGLDNNPIKEKAEQVVDLMKGDTEQKYRALEIAEGVEDETWRRRLIGQVVSSLTLDLEAENTPESLLASEELKAKYFGEDAEQPE